MQRNIISFKGQKIYIGIDVHLKKWHVTCVTESNYKKSIEQPADADTLFSFLTKTFPHGDYHAAYEAGFTGFSTYHSLAKHGINTIVVNAADIPSTQYDKVMKTDRVDSEKLAFSLKAGLLRGIYIRKEENADDLSLVRLRKSIQGEVSANKVRIKLLLYSNGVSIPEHLGTIRWSAAYATWLRTEAKLLSESRKTLEHLVDHVEVLHKEYLKVNRSIRDLIRSDKYRSFVELLMSIPGIGPTTAITLLTEIGDFSRFNNEREFASYLGLIPSSHNSGEKVLQNTITFRGNKRLGAALTEASWKSIARDHKLGAFFLQCRKRMNAQKSIVKVARKLSNIIFSIMKNKVKYDPDR